MGIDYNAVGGIGVEFNDKLQRKALELGYFTEEEWNEDPYSCIASLGIMYAQAGDDYVGDTYWYFLVDGRNLTQINKKQRIFS